MTVTMIERLQYNTDTTVDERYGTRTLRYTNATVHGRYGTRTLQYNSTLQYIYKDSILVNRVDPRVSVYERTPPEEYVNGA